MTRSYGDVIQHVDAELINFDFTEAAGGEELFLKSCGIKFASHRPTTFPIFSPYTFQSSSLKLYFNKNVKNALRLTEKEGRLSIHAIFNSIQMRFI